MIALCPVTIEEFKPNPFGFVVELFIKRAVIR